MELNTPGRPVIELSHTSANDSAVERTKLRSAFARLHRKLKPHRRTDKAATPNKFKLQLQVNPSEDGCHFSIIPQIVSLKSKLPIAFMLGDIDVQIASGVIMLRETMHVPQRVRDLVLLSFLQAHDWTNLPIETLDLWIELYFALPHRAPLQMSPQLGWRESRASPMVSVHLSRGPREGTTAPWRTEIFFCYGLSRIEWRDPHPTALDFTTKTIYLRDAKTETELVRQLGEASPIPSSHELRSVRDPQSVPKLAPTNDSQIDSTVDLSLVIVRERSRVTRIELPAQAFTKLVRHWLMRSVPIQIHGKQLGACRFISQKLSTTANGFDLAGWLEFDKALEASDSVPPTAEAVFANATSVKSAPHNPLGSQPVPADSALLIPLTALSLQLDFDLGLIHLDEMQIGFVSPEYLPRLSALVKLGRETGVAIHYQLAQGPVLAALFADWLNKSELDSAFTELVQRFNDHREIRPQAPCASFRGSLRHYQQEGLGWLTFLSATGFGGILADDMGLGKTVQVISHLANEYEKNPKAPLSLVILPKSLLFNWEEEIAKFAPRIRAAVYEGSQKRPLFSQIKDVQVLLVTYNTLRQDIESLRELEFHYVIADEAQAIKNPSSMIHRACLEIHAKHRLAMSGTPVENSVQDLFSIFDFVSPGLIGAKMKQRALQQSSQADLLSVAQALKPFILRRTKEQVLKDLPAKTEKVLYCKLGPVELKRYQQIRDHYKLIVKSSVATNGLSNSGFAVLEGLLRLRQAASHPGLVDKKWLGESSSKLEAFMEQLEGVIALGHKALVFSQFTGLLDIVQASLIQAKTRFVRIDGSASSRQRQASVKEFQSDPQLPVFLISLKAGGTGLNLTAADYVFILDPWWNPAAESQAIDRAHRMGQKNKVIAYRMITKGTVEEKIMALQKTKRALADALISQDGSMLKALSNSDIELLFS